MVFLALRFSALWGNISALSFLLFRPTDFGPTDQTEQSRKDKKISFPQLIRSAFPFVSDSFFHFPFLNFVIFILLQPTSNAGHCIEIRIYGLVPRRSPPMWVVQIDVVQDGIARPVIVGRHLAT